MTDRGANPQDVEVEWQLDALDLRPVERWLAGGARMVPGLAGGAPIVVSAVERPVKRLVDVYLDTDDWRIGRSGFVLRVRHQADTGEVTLKDTTPAVTGLRHRVEVTEPLPPGGVEALGTGGPVGRRLHALAGSAALVNVLEVRTRRRPYQLQAAGQTVGEVDLDDTIIVVGDDQYPVRLRRVEIEVDPAWVETLTPLVDHLRAECALQPAVLSKFEAGLLAAGRHVPATPDLGVTELPAEPSIGDMAMAVLRRHVAAMVEHEPGTRLGEDPEELHDMRVATRRLRAALDLFATVLPGRAHHLREELGWLADGLGAVRDLDVQLERLEQWRSELPVEESGSLDDLARLLQRQRDAARLEMLASLDSPRYDEIVSGFTSILQQGARLGDGGPSADALAPAAAVVPDLILTRHRAVTKAARRARRSGDLADFHRLRIRCKRLRYALEFVSEIYDGQTRKMVRRVVALQDCLGLMQDARVAQGRLLSLATAEDGLPRATVFAMGRLAERYRHETDHLVDTLAQHFDMLNGGQWRKLKSHMEARRLAVGPIDAWPQVTRGRVEGRGGVGPVARGPDGGVRAAEGAPRRTPVTPVVAPLGRTPAATQPAGAPSGDHVDELIEMPDDEHWDEHDVPTLRAVPPIPTVSPEPPLPVPPPTVPPVLPLPAPPPAASPHVVEPQAPRRRKDPVFLPRSPVASPGARPDAQAPPRDQHRTPRPSDGAP